MSAKRGEEGLDYISDLKPGWDSYGGVPITPAALHTARVLLKSTPWVIPCSDGGIQLEWHEQGVDFEIIINSLGTSGEQE